MRLWWSEVPLYSLAKEENQEHIYVTFLPALHTWLGEDLVPGPVAISFWQQWEAKIQMK